MKKAIFAIIAVAFTLISFISISSAQSDYEDTYTATGNVNIVYGQKEMNTNDWQPTDLLEEGQVNLDLRDRTWPISLYIAYSKAQDSEMTTIFGYDTTKLTLETSELDFGVKKIWDGNEGYNESGVHLYLAGGLSEVTASAKISVSYLGDTISINRTDSAIGVFANTGIYYSINNIINIGVDVKYSTAQVNFGGGESVDIGGLHYGLILGYHF